MSTTATTTSPCPSPTLRPAISNTHSIALRSPSTFIFPSELRSPLCSSFPLPSHTACSTTTATSTTTNTSLSSMSTPAIATMIEPLKTPITPPAAYTAFLQSAISHASASNTPVRATFADAGAALPKSPRYLPGSASLSNQEGSTSSTPAKVPLSPMYVEFLKQHFGHGVHRPVARRFRASVSGPAGMQRGGGSAISSGLNPTGNGRTLMGDHDPPRSPGLVMLGNAGIINGSLRNKEAIINAHRVRAAAAAAAAATAEYDKEKSNQKDKSVVEEEEEEEEPGSSASSVSSSCSSTSSLFSDSSPLESGSTATITPSTAGASSSGHSQSATIRKIEPEASPVATSGERKLQVPKSERKRPSEGDTAQVSDSKGVGADDNIKESTVEFSEGKTGPTAMSLMPAPKGKRRKIE